MKRTAALLLSMVLPVAGFAAEPSTAKDEEPEQIYALANEVQAQQAIIAQNQDKIDVMLTKVAEEIRVARIFASRGR